MKPIITKLCVICCSPIPPKQRSRSKHDGRSALENLCNFLDVCYSSFETFFSIDYSAVLFCMDCNTKILNAIELKKKLLAIKTGLRRISIASEYPQDSKTLSSTENAFSLWTFIRQTLSGCHVVVSSDVTEFSSSKTDNHSLIVDLHPSSSPIPLASFVSIVDQGIKIESAEAEIFNCEPGVASPKKRRMCTEDSRNVVPPSNYDVEIDDVTVISSNEESDWVPEDEDDGLKGQGEADDDGDTHKAKRRKAKVHKNESQKDDVKDDSDWDPGDEVDGDGGSGNSEENQNKIEILKRLDEEVAKAVRISLHPQKGNLSESTIEDQGQFKVIGEECDSCTALCISVPLLELHKKEVHNAEDDTGLNLSYQCELCDSLLEATCFLRSEEHVPGNKCYSVVKDHRVVNFTFFYEVCEHHYLECCRRSQSAEVQKQSREVDFYEDYHSFTPCHVCDLIFPVPSLSQHYKKSHGINLWHGARLSCGYCNEPYMASSPETPVGRYIPEEAEHFKAFVDSHKKCKNVCQGLSKREYTCSNCGDLFHDVNLLFAHSMSEHTNERNFKCEACLKYFLNFKHLRHHIRKFHFAATRVHCGRCTASFPSRTSYIDHIKLHSSRQAERFCVSEQFQCALCPRILKGGRILRMHILNSHLNAVKTIIKPQLRHRLPVPKPQNSFQCFLCGEKCYSVQVLSLHLRAVHDEEEILSFKCLYCCKEFIKSDCALATVQDGTITYGEAPERVFTTFLQFSSDHILACGKDPKTQSQNNRTAYKCSKCKETFTKQGGMASHLRTHYMKHVQKWRLDCILCTGGGNDERELENHVLTAHNLKKICMDQYYCRYCLSCYIPLNQELETGRLVMEEVSNFKIFAAVHQDCKKPWKLPDVVIKCKFCDRSFDHPKGAFRHELSEHTKNFPLFCEICGTGAATLEDLTHHKRHHREKKFICELCPLAFRSRQKLEAHMNVHNDHRPFVCEICGKSFHSYNNLVCHGSVHRGRKRFECPNCLRVFRKDYATKHKCKVDKDGNPLKSSTRKKKGSNNNPTRKRPSRAKSDPDGTPRKRGRPQKSIEVMVQSSERDS